MSVDTWSMSIPCPSHPALHYPLSWTKVKVRAHMGHKSSVDTLSCTNSSGLCLESVADYQIHTSCDHVFLVRLNMVVRLHRQQTLIITCTSLVFKFSSPKASLMWPLQPHLVRSSTGLNHKISSETERKKNTSQFRTVGGTWDKIISSYLC